MIKKNLSMYIEKFKIREILPLLVLNIALPTVNVYSDLYLIIKLLINGHPKWAGLLLAPFLFNYFFSWFLWWRIDKKKHITWIAVALSCYPQYCAFKVIKLLWTDTEEGLKKKRKFEREISEFEVFCEAVFSVLVITFIMVKGLSSNEREFIIGKDGSTDYYLFFLAYSTSILTASLGLAKCLKVGPCRILPEGGFVTGKFLLLVFAAGTTLVTKGMAIAITMSHVSCQLAISCVTGRTFRFGNLEPDPVYLIYVVLYMMFLPGLLMAMVSVCRNKDTLKTVAAHPSILLLPAFTYFTFSTNMKLCCKSENNGVTETRIMFSRNWTLANLGASVVGYIGYFAIAEVLGFGEIVPLWQSCLPLVILSILLTLLFLFLDYCCCSCTTDLQFAVLNVDDPHTEYVVDKDTSGEQEIITMEEWRNRQDGKFAYSDQVASHDVQE